MGRKPILKREQVLKALHEWAIRHGVPPTVQELRRVLRVGSTRTVLRYLQQLEEDGSIERWSGARGIRIRRAPSDAPQTVTVPIVGEAPAGPLMTAEQNLEGWVRIPTSFARPRGMSFFLLRVRGDSMNRARVQGERIENGDLVLVRQQPTAETNDIVVAISDGEATIKRFVKGKDYAVLKAESSKEYEPIVVDEGFTVQGVVCRVLKKGSELLTLERERT